MKIVALQTQQSMRDISALPELCDEVQWLDEGSLAQSRDAAVIVGTWLFESPDEAKALIAARCDRGGATIIVPRWKAGNLQPVLGTPAKVVTEFGEFDQFTVDDRELGIPGQSIIKTPLHNGRWGETKGGATILAYRPSEGAGAVVLCTAALASQRFGVDTGVQRELLVDLIQRATSVAGLAKVQDEQRRPAVTTPATVDEYLAAGSQNAAVLLAMIVNGGDTNADKITETLNALGMDTGADELNVSLEHLRSIEPTIEEMEAALMQYGWSAYLRLARQRFPNQATTQAETESSVTQGEAIER